jgi:hypothetical protein
MSFARKWNAYKTYRFVPITNAQNRKATICFPLYIWIALDSGYIFCTGCSVKFHNLGSANIFFSDHEQNAMYFLLRDGIRKENSWSDGIKMRDLIPSHL